MKNDFFRIHALFTRTTSQSPCLHEILATGGVYGLDKGEEKMKLIKNIDVYAPEPLGKKDVLILGDKIAKIRGGRRDAGDSVSFTGGCDRWKRQDSYTGIY